MSGIGIAERMADAVGNQPVEIQAREKLHEALPGRTVGVQNTAWYYPESGILPESRRVEYCVTVFRCGPLSKTSNVQSQRTGNDLDRLVDDVIAEVLCDAQ